MPNHPDQMLIRARLTAHRHKQEFLKKWGQYPAALPSIIETELGKGAKEQPGGEGRPQGFNQFENPNSGGLSHEIVEPVSDRVSATSTDEAGNDTAE